MAEKRTIDLEIKDNSKSLKAQYKDAVLEVQKLADAFGATSVEVQQASKKAAELKDQIEDVNDAIQAQKGEGKFLALGKSITAVASGFSAAQGAMGLFGSESKEVEQAMLKVQSAMALAQGLEGLEDAGRSFKQLKSTIVASITAITTAKVAETTATEAGVVAENQGLLAKGKNLVISGLQAVATTVLTAAQYAYNLAMSLNPIGLIIVAVTALIAAGYALINMFMAQNKANIEAEAGTKRATAALNSQIKSAEKASKALETKNGHEFNMAKAAGASAEALRKLALKHADETIALDQASYATAKNTYEKEKNTLANLQNAGVADEQIKKQTELVTKARENATKEREDLSKSYEAKQAIIRANEVELATEKFNAEKKTTENSKGTAKEQIDITRQLQDEKLKLVADGEQKELDVIKLTYLRKNEDREKDVKDGKLKRKDADILLAQDILTQQTDEQKVRNKFSEARIKKEDEDFLKLQKLTLSEREFAKLELAQKFDDQQLQAKGNAELTAELTKQQQKELDALNVTFNAKELADKQNLEKAKLDAVKNYNSIVLNEQELARQAIDQKQVTELAKLTTDFDLKLLTEEQYNLARQELTKKTNEEIAKLDVDANQKKQDLLNKQLDAVKTGLQSIANIAELFAGKNKKSQKRAFEIQKVANIASATIDTFKSAQSAYASIVGIPVVGPVLAPIAAGGAVAAGLINIRKIKDSKFEGGESPSADTSGGGAIGSGGSSAPQAPQFNVVGNSGINQLAQLQQTPMQAFVVSGEVTSAQSLDRNRIQNATL